MSDLNAIALAPTFNPHRVAVAAADGAPPDGEPEQGVNGAGYDAAIIEVVRKAGTFTSCTAKVKFYSDDAGVWLDEKPAISHDLTANAHIKVDTNGRRFWVMISAMVGADLELDVNVAGADQRYA